MNRRLKRWWRRSRPLVLMLVALVLAVLAGCGGTTVRTVTVRAPEVQSPVTPKPGAIAPPARQTPSCGAQELREVEEGKGKLGSCAPKPHAFGVAPPRVTRGQSGPDVSNNDPFYNWHPVKSHGHPFGYVKVNQGTGFIDSTAQGMVKAMRAAGIVPGGYDFLEVCRTSSIGEARLFAARLRAIGLVSHSLVPIGDAEWPLSAPCSASAARSWLESWGSEVHSLTGRWPGYYTGAWWANPNLGCWRPPHGGKRWVSGYTSRRNLSIPSCWGGVDLWQYTDAGYNGVSNTDMSVLEVSLASFGGVELTPAQRRAAKLQALRAREAERRDLHRLIDAHHCRRGQHNTPRQPLRSRRAYHRLCGEWVRRGGHDIVLIKQYRHELKI